MYNNIILNETRWNKVKNIFLLFFNKLRKVVKFRISVWENRKSDKNEEINMRLNDSVQWGVLHTNLKQEKLHSGKTVRLG